MAKFEDYEQKGELDQEIADAADKSETREGESSFKMPERFTGKSAEEIAQSYTELESLNSRQAQDLGTMRRTVDEFLTLKSVQPDPDPVELEPITVDDLYDDPQGAIARGVEAATGDRISQLEQELVKARLQTRVSSMNDRFEGWQEEVRSPEFVTWVQESPYRLRIAQAADKWDMDAAEEIIEMYRDVKGVSSDRDQVQRDLALSDASLESSSAEVPLLEDTFSRAVLLTKRIAARHGDPEAEAYMKQNAEAIAIAYEEGNITD